MYPVTYQADYQAEGRNRLTVFFRYFTQIPVMIVGFFYAIGAYVCQFIAWFALVFTGRYPQGLYDFNVKALRMYSRAYAYSVLLTDQYPPFDGEPDDSYPVRVQVGPPQESYSRLKVFFRGLFLIPVYVVLLVYGLGIGLATFVAWFAIVLTGRHPEGLFNLARNGLAYNARAGAYMLLLTDEFPPISEEPQVAPAAAA
jgi:hypothetical protein